MLRAAFTALPLLLTLGLAGPATAAPRHVVTLQTGPKAPVQRHSPVAAQRWLPWSIGDWRCTVESDPRRGQLTVDCFDAFSTTGVVAILEGEGKSVLVLRSGRRSWRLGLHGLPESPAIALTRPYQPPRGVSRRLHSPPVVAPPVPRCDRP